MDLSIVIVSYNNRDLTRQCLKSIVKHTAGVVYEIIVVDNCSRDGSAEMVEGEFPEVRLIRSPQNLGYGCGANLGLLRATGDCLLVQNNDILYDGNTAAMLVERINTVAPRIGMIGPQVLNPDRTVAPSARRLLLARPIVALGIVNRHFNLRGILPSDVLMRKTLGSWLKRFHDNYDTHDEVKSPEYLDGMLFLVRREVLERVGLFDEQFFFDWEILDLSQRVRAAGWQMEYFPAAKAIHLGHASRKKVSWIIIETHKSELLYYAKHYPEMVPYVRRTATQVVALKLALLKAKQRFGNDEAMRVEIYTELLKVCRKFDVSGARSKQRIPTLLPLGKTAVRLRPSA